MPETYNIGYPYPVLLKEPVYYNTAVFVSTLISKDRDQLTDGFEFIPEFKVTSPVVQKLLDDGKAVFKVRIVCKSTMYREMPVVQNGVPFKVPFKDVRFRFTLQPFIVAIDDIIGFYDNDFIEDYQGRPYNLDYGFVIGIGDEGEVETDYVQDKLKNGESIFRIVPSEDKGMDIDLSKRYILVKIPVDQVNDYIGGESDAEKQWLYDSVLFIPALIEAIYKISEVEASDDVDDYENPIRNKAWYSSLKEEIDRLAEIQHKTPQELLEHPTRTAEMILGENFKHSLKLINKNRNTDRSNV